MYPFSLTSPVFCTLNPLVVLSPGSIATCPLKTTIHVLIPSQWPSCTCLRWIPFETLTRDCKMCIAICFIWVLRCHQASRVSVISTSIATGRYSWTISLSCSIYSNPAFRCDASMVSNSCGRCIRWIRPRCVCVQACLIGPNNGPIRGDEHPIRSR